MNVRFQVFDAGIIFLLMGLVVATHRVIAAGEPRVLSEQSWLGLDYNPCTLVYGLKEFSKL